MNISADDEFLKKYRIDVPEPSSLAVFHAEAITLIPGVGYTFSDFARGLIGDLIAERNQAVDEFLRSVASDKTATNHTIIVFLDGPYDMAEHIWAIRSSIEEVAMLSCTTPPPYDLKVPPPTGGLFVADVPTLASLGKRSPFLGQLLQIADGPPDDFVWAYFLGKADSKEVSAREEIEIPLKRIEPAA